MRAHHALRQGVLISLACLCTQGTEFLYTLTSERVAISGTACVHRDILLCSRYLATMYTTSGNSWPSATQTMHIHVYAHTPHYRLLTVASERVPEISVLIWFIAGKRHSKWGGKGVFIGVWDETFAPTHALELSPLLYRFHGTSKTMCNAGQQWCVDVGGCMMGTGASRYWVSEWVSWVCVPLGEHHRSIVLCVVAMGDAPCVHVRGGCIHSLMCLLTKSFTSVRNWTRPG